MGALDGQTLCTPNAWEEVKRKGDASIERWIDENLAGKSCVVVLVGAETANRHWVQTEIAKGWNAGKGVLGIRINSLLDSAQQTSRAGLNPFDFITMKNGSVKLSDHAKLKTPAGFDSKAVYASIQQNIEAWIEEAIQIRNNYR